tara:strand:- start:4021 stop:4638 length:618 start_codon:yes stop_codon:yes gene_type:complete
VDQTEEQQVERIKEFWAEHGKGIIAGAIIGLGLFFGWRYYDKATIEAQNAASRGYEAVVSQLNAGEEGAITNAQNFIKSNPDSQYGYLAALQLGRFAAEEGDLATAVTSFQSIIESGADDNLAAIARVRLARVLSAQAQYQSALDVLNVELPKAYSAFANEIKGDVYAAQGDVAKAREAYESALNSDGSTLSPAVELKLNSLAKS